MSPGRTAWVEQAVNEPCARCGAPSVWCLVRLDKLGVYGQSLLRGACAQCKEREDAPQP